MTVLVLALLMATGLPLLMAGIAWYSERPIALTEGLSDFERAEAPTTQRIEPAKQTLGHQLWDESNNAFYERPTNLMLWEYSNDAQLEWTFDEKPPLWSDETFILIHQNGDLDTRLAPISEATLTPWSDDGP